jgi:hypothetical protein
MLETESPVEPPPHPDRASLALSTPQGGRGRDDGLPPPHLPKRGAAFRNTNRLKHGRYSGVRIARRKEIMQLVREGRALMRRLAGELPNADRTV